jgi:hypothetical protein
MFFLKASRMLLFTQNDETDDNSHGILERINATELYDPLLNDQEVLRFI